MVTDVLKIIRKSLLYNVELFIESHEPRNPYTNIKFSYNFLVNFYNYLKINSINTGLIFDLFYKSNLDLLKYKIDYECIIRDEIIKEYYMNYTENELYTDIIYIINFYKPTTNIYIHCNYDKKIIVDTFKPIMTPHLFYFYSINKQKIYKNKMFVIKFLNNIEKKSPIFGFKSTPEYNMLYIRSQLEDTPALPPLFSSDDDE